MGWFRQYTYGEIFNSSSASGSMGVPAAEYGIVEAGAVIQQVGTRLRKLLLSVITEPVVLRGEPLPLENIRTVCRLRLPERSILVIGRRTTVRQHHTHAAKMVLHIQQKLSPDGPLTRRPPENSVESSN